MHHLAGNGKSIIILIKDIMNSFARKSLAYKLMMFFDKENLIKKSFGEELYERGARYTLASGSSSCAAAGATVRLGMTKSPVHVHMPGGVLHIEIDAYYHVCMTGEVEYIGKMEIFEGFQ